MSCVGPTGPTTLIQTCLFLAVPEVLLFDLLPVGGSQGLEKAPAYLICLPPSDAPVLFSATQTWLPGCGLRPAAVYTLWLGSLGGPCDVTLDE